MEGILLTIKKMLGIESSFDGFDVDIIILINNALMALNQLGIGPAECFVVDGIDDKWTDFIGNATNLEGVKTYIYLKVRLIFDPPANSFTIDAINRQLTELEWRLSDQVEYIPAE